MLEKSGRTTWKMKDRMIKKCDNVMKDNLPTDIVIPVMGPTGVGKSTFINILLEKDAMLVSHKMTSCTSILQYAIVDNPSPCEGHRVIIVDTPGFDDTYIDDVEILRRIAVWLASSYNDNMKLGGVIYLHNIADKKMKGTTLRNLDMFRQLCGDNALGRVILGTTNWGGVKEKEGEIRQQELVENFWKDMVKLGSKLLRFDQTKKSAQNFLDAILDQLIFDENGEILNDIPLQIQKELVALGRRIPQTKAGRALRRELKQVRDKYNEDGDSKKAAALLAKIEKQVDELRLTLIQKVFLKISGRN